MREGSEGSMKSWGGVNGTARGGVRGVNVKGGGQESGRGVNVREGSRGVNGVKGVKGVNGRGQGGQGGQQLTPLTPPLTPPGVNIDPCFRAYMPPSLNHRGVV